MIDQNLILVIFMISIAIANKALYYYDNTQNKGKKIESLRSFSYIQKYLRLSTLLIAIASIYSNSPYLYNIPSIKYVYLGTSLCAISTVILFIARFNLSHNYSPCYDMKAPQDFIQHGVYRIVRHPIYLSNLLLLVGVFFISGSMWIALNFSILAIYYSISALKEESYLSKRFPAYSDYKTSTSMFIPGYKLIKK